MCTQKVKVLIVVLVSSALITANAAARDLFSYHTNESHSGDFSDRVNLLNYLGHAQSGDVVTLGFTVGGAVRSLPAGSVITVGGREYLVSFMPDTGAVQLLDEQDGSSQFSLDTGDTIDVRDH